MVDVNVQPRSLSCFQNPKKRRHCQKQNESTKSENPRASQHDLGWKAKRTTSRLPVAHGGPVFTIDFPLYRTRLTAQVATLLGWLVLWIAEVFRGTHRKVNMRVCCVVVADFSRRRAFRTARRRCSYISVWRPLNKKPISWSTDLNTCGRTLFDFPVIEDLLMTTKCPHGY